jgi:serine/threonine-protein kinase
VAHRIRTERPPPIPAERRIPIDLERLVQRALGKSPGHRPSSGAELAKEIAAIPMPDERESELHKLFGKLGLSEVKSASAALSLARDGSDDERAREPSVRPVALRLGALFAAMVVVGAAFQAVERMDTDSDKGARSNGPGYVRVLAHPWAEVWVDGALVDTTPIGRPLSLASGRHTFLFKHPRAEEERRLVDVAPDTTTTLDVTMKVARPPPDAGVDASP